MAEVYNSKYYTATEIDERLKQSLYLDAKAKGYKGTFDEFISQLIGSTISYEEYQPNK